MKAEHKKTIREYFKAVDIDNIEQPFKGRLIRATVGLINTEGFENIKAFFPLCFGDDRNLINVVNPKCKLKI